MKKGRFRHLKISGGILLALVTTITLHHCTKEAIPPMDKANLIPLPAKVTPTEGVFRLKKGTVIYVSNGSDEAFRVGDYLSGFLHTATGYKLPVKATNKTKGKKDIFLFLSRDREELGKEGYVLRVTPEMISITAWQPAGLFYGTQTLRQLLPDEIEKKSVQRVSWEVPAGTITDKPEYAYRGAMLDVARHFFPPEDVKAYMDMLAFFKINILHLHLSDDQGWRIEIKSWPKLTEIGGSTEVGGGKGGFYTREEYKDLVKYASDRFITIIPEIDMPGHTNAALASYGVLNCDNKPRKLYTGIDVGFSTLCISKDTVYRFIDDVMGELAALTPGPWIHIGGDESHATPMKDYIPFIERTQQIVWAHKKYVIGWDEIANATIDKSTVIQYWDNNENTLKGVRQGAKVIMSPASRTYLDMQYDSTCTLGLHWSGYVEVDKAYDWDPATLVPGVEKKNILGVESPLWTETITNMKELEYMVFPRLAGHAEIGWTPASERKCDDYKIRLGHFASRFDAMGINFYHSPLIRWNDEEGLSTNKEPGASKK